MQCCKKYILGLCKLLINISCTQWVYVDIHIWIWSSLFVIYKETREIHLADSLWYDNFPSYSQVIRHTHTHSSKEIVRWTATLFMKEPPGIAVHVDQLVFSVLSGQLVLSWKRRSWAFTRNFAVSLTSSAWENKLRISANRHVLARGLNLCLKTS